MKTGQALVSKMGQHGVRNADRSPRKSQKVLGILKMLGIAFSFHLNLNRHETGQSKINSPSPLLQIRSSISKRHRVQAEEVSNQPCTHYPGSQIQRGGLSPGPPGSKAPC